MTGLTMIRLGNLGTGSSCAMTVAGAGVGGQSALALIDSTFSVTTNAVTSATVRSVVIYGAKPP
jgi:hypothetical protein